MLQRMHCSKISAASIFIALFLCPPCPSARAADGKSEALWLANLIKENYGKTFCAPPATTVGEIARAFGRYADAHPEFHGKLTEAQTIQGLSEAYPCQKISPNTPIAELAKKGVKNIVVQPTGEFTSIDTRSIGSTMQKLRGTVARENDTLVNQMIKHSGNYAPPEFFALADLLYRRGDIDDALFWYNVARLRGGYDAALCTDVSARSAIPALIAQMPPDLIKKQYDDIPRVRSIIERVIKWDESTPYNYDHRWISLHGVRAISSGLGTDSQHGPLIEPRDKWDQLAKLNRTQFRAAVEESIAMVQKQKAGAAHAYDVPVKLGDTIEKVKAVYHTAAEPEAANIPGRLAVKLLQIPEKGTWLFFDEDEIIYAIRLERPFPGQVAGVKIGDSADSVLHTLGSPQKRLPMPGLHDALIYQPDSRFSTNIRFDHAGTVETIYLSR